MSHLSRKPVVTAKEYKRHPHDFFPTPEECTVAFLKAEQAHIPQVVWEPACGNGALAEVLRATGRTVICTDLYDRGCPDSQSGMDFFEQTTPKATAVVTNTPWRKSMAVKFALHAQKIGIKYFSMLVPVRFWSPPGRLFLWDAWKPARVLTLSWRPDLFGIGDPDQRCELQWIVWDARHQGKPTFDLLPKPTLNANVKDKVQ